MLERIGSGAYGEVWLARNQATGARRAIKIVYRATFTDDRPFHREFEGIKKFEAISHSHPSQLALFHVARNSAADYFYYVMELGDEIPSSVGDDVRSLSSSVSRSETPHVVSYKPRTLRSDLETGRLPADRVLQLALSLTEALHHLHSHNLIHRDIKPSNIIFVSGRPKLADIGLVTDASDSRSIVGTEGYLAPEGPGTPRADLFALGKVLYEAITGLDRRQFPELPADIRQWPDAKLAFELNTIILKLCASNSKDRYSTAAEAITDLQHLNRGKSVQRRYQFQRIRSTALKTALALTLLLAAFTIYRHNQAPARPNTKDRDDFAHSGTTNFAAWEAYTRAGILSERFSPFGFSNAISYYERALELDPNYTAAWSKLAMATSLATEKGFIPGPEGLRRALDAAEKALLLDPNNAYALHWKAYSILGLDYDFPRAEPLFKKAIQMDPTNLALRHNYAGNLWKYGRLDEAEAILRDMLRDAPQRGHTRMVLGFVLEARGKLSDALSQMDDAILLLPAGFPVIYFERGLLLWELGRRDEACRDWKEYIRLGGFPMLPTDDPGLAAAPKLNPEQFVRALIARLEKCRADGAFVSSFDLARFYAILGDKPRALDYLETSVDEHRIFTLSARHHFVFRDFQNEPRYHAVLRRLKLE